MITLYCWNVGQKAGMWLGAEVLATRTEQLRATSDVLWIDLDNPTEEEESLVFKQFLPVHPLTLEDVTKLRHEPDGLPHFPKAEEFNDYLFVVIDPLAPRLVDALKGKPGASLLKDGRATTQLSAVLTKTV